MKEKPTNKPYHNSNSSSNSNFGRILKVVLLVLVLAIVVALALDLAGIISIDSLFSGSGLIPGNATSTATSKLATKENYKNYNAFLQALEDKSIVTANIKEDCIEFTTEEGIFVTDNPDSPTLKERLLQAGAQVTTTESTSINTILDIIFDAVFFIAIGFGIYKLISYSHNTFKVVHNTGVHFSDIAGMDNVKTDMLFLADILKNPSAYSGKGLRQVKGVILEGPPGNGKTLFAKALAQETHVNFIATKGADFQSALMSMGARKIKMLFSKASRRKPCIIFIDEFDSIGERRNYAGTGIDKENNRIITTMLNEMDGFLPNNGLMVIAATNSYASLDPALIRPGRFDLKYTIENPDASTRAQLIDIYTKGKNLSPDLDKQNLVTAFDGLSCAAIETILNQAQAISHQTESAITINHILVAAQKTGAKLNIKTRR